jgi:hypothetical protein
MKLRLINIGHQSGEYIVHAINTDDVQSGTFCGAGIDWRYDSLLGVLTDSVEVECPRCRDDVKAVLRSQRRR